MFCSEQQPLFLLSFFLREGRFENECYRSPFFSLRFEVRGSPRGTVVTVFFLALFLVFLL